MEEPKLRRLYGNEFLDYISNEPSKKYKYVYLQRRKSGDVWLGQISRSKKNKLNKTWKIWKKTEREAALAVDKFLLSIGLEPVNILKKVES